MVTDLVQIRQLALDQEEENLRFRRYLKGRHVPHRALERIAHGVAAAIDCKACANCCRETEVNPTAEDIEQIAAYLGITSEQVVRLYTAPEHSAAGGMKLRQGPGGCVFLDGNLCMVYEARPSACRDFPCMETEENTLGARMSSVCAKAAVCPIIYNALEEYKKLTGFKVGQAH